MSSTYPYGGIPSRPCQRCGMPLPVNEVQCGNCGYYNAQPTGGIPPGQPSVPNMPWGGGVPQTSYTQDQYANQQWGQPSEPAAAPRSNFFGPPRGSLASPPVSSPSSGSFQPSPSENNYSGAPSQFASSGNYAAAPNQYASSGNYSAVGATQQPPFAPPSMPMGNGFQQGNGYAPQAGGYNQFTPPPQQQKPNVRLIVGVVILLVVLIGGGLAGYTFIKSSHNSANTISTPTTAKPTPTPSVPPLFVDSFKDNSKGWNMQGDPGKFSVTVGNGTMVLEDDDNRLLWELVPGGKTFSDMRLSVDAVLSKGEQNNGYGIYIRGASNQNTDLATYYRFEFYGDGTYAVFKGVVDANGTSNGTKLVDYTQSSAILKQGGVNHITIIAKGPSFSLIVNGQTLTTFSDGSYTSGSVALFVSNLKGSTPIAQATFSNFAIYPPQA